ncbi:hypothetical protein ABZ079_21655 [Streptomyces sp. NPDC006314]|uniref:hypothetical protein n=1 Tax=Streptomyces sp. NPDC006314 TaxID=3154475 RepID=UPI0033B457E4
MAETEALRQALEQCARRADRIGFTFADGREFLGWAEEVTDAGVLVSWAPNPFYFQSTSGGAWEPDDEWVTLTHIAAESISAYDESAGRWVPLLRL